MGDVLAKSVLFQAPAGPFVSSHIVWDELPLGTPEGGVKRPFLWLERRGAKTTMIYFHGNAEDLMDVESDLQLLSDEMSVNVLAVEYPGYGLLRSEESQVASKLPGMPPWVFSLCSRGHGHQNSSQTTVEGIDKAAVHALAYVVMTLGIPCSQVVLFGRSLGSGVALRLARHARDNFHWSVGAVVLQCPYISIRQIVSDHACSAGSFLIPPYYDNLATLKELCVNCPVAMGAHRWVPLLILHGEQDEIIWSYHGRTLYEEALRHGHPYIEARFANNATHNKWDLLEDVIFPTRGFLRKYVLGPSSGQPYMAPGCFGPSGANRRRGYGSASCSGGRATGNNCIGFTSGINVLEMLLSNQCESRHPI